MMRGLAIVALLACSRPVAERAPQADPSPCPRVADHLVSLMSAATKHPAEATDPLRRAITERCTTDRWSAEATRCLLELPGLADGARCQALMTEAQVEAFQRDTEAATSELRAQLDKHPPHDAASD
jgi:hypothetical protein